MQQQIPHDQLEGTSRASLLGSPTIGKEVMKSLVYFRALEWILSAETHGGSISI
jgi:hypothetical protein